MKVQPPAKELGEHFYCGIVAKSPDGGERLIYRCLLGADDCPVGGERESIQ